MRDEVRKVYTGPMVTAQMISEKLRERGIKNFQDDNIVTKNSIPEKLDVYVYKQDLFKAQQVIEEAYIDLLDQN